METETCDDPEVATATAATGPEQVRVPMRIAVQQPSVSGQDPKRLEVVGGRAQPPRDEPDATAEREPPDPNRCAGAGRDGSALRCQRGVDVDQAGTGTDDSRPALGADSAQPRQVDHNAGACRVAGIAMTARAGHDRNAGLLRPAD